MTEKRTHKRRTQAERSETTRMQLCEATLETLHDLGYANTSTQEIASRANVSRGALTHQFTSRNDLIISSFEYLVNKWETEWPFHSDEGVPLLSMDQLIDVLWEMMFDTGRYFASLEMMLAARIDDELGKGLRTVLNRWVSVRDPLIAQMLGLSPDDPAAARFVQINLSVMRGISVHASFDSNRDNHALLLADWKRMMRIVLENDPQYGIRVCATPK